MVQKVAAAGHGQSSTCLFIPLDIMTGQSKNFKLEADQLGVWLNEYQGQIRIHFHQPSEDPKKPKKNYIFLNANKINQLSYACDRILEGNGWPGESPQILVDQQYSGSATYVTELAKHGETVLLQSRNTKYATPMRTIHITDLAGFKDILHSAGSAFAAMVFQDARDKAGISKSPTLPRIDELQLEEKKEEKQFPALQRQASFYVPRM